MDAEQLKVAQDSYARCCQAPDFFNTFYAALLAGSPLIPPMFANTDFDRQNRSLQHAIGLLLSYYRGRDSALLKRIAQRHTPADLNIPATLYPLWVDCLVTAVGKHDPEFGPKVERAWRTTVAPGIDYIIKYQETS